MISNIQKIAAPDPRSLRPHFPGGISTPRHAPAPSDGENILRDKDATRDSHLDIREPGERRQRHGRDGNKTLSFRGKSGAWEEGGQFRRQSVSVIKKLNKYYEAREKYLNHR